MSTKTVKPAEFCAEFERICAMREHLISDAFQFLEHQNEPLANAVLACLGDRRRAAWWMSRPQRAFSGKTAYHYLADGDEDGIWDEIERMSLIE
jgi:hypothetical protein